MKVYKWLDDPDIVEAMSGVEVVTVPGGIYKISGFRLGHVLKTAARIAAAQERKRLFHRMIDAFDTNGDDDE